MRDDIPIEEVLGKTCEMVCGGNGHNNSLWASQIMDGALNRGVSVSVKQPEDGVRGIFHAAEMNVAMQGGSATRPGMQPAPELAAPPEPARDNTPKPPGATMG